MKPVDQVKIMSHSRESRCPLYRLLSFLIRLSCVVILFRKSGEPRTDGDCMVYGNEMVWSSVECEEERIFVCQYQNSAPGIFYIQI